MSAAPATEPSAVRTYRTLRNASLVKLLGRWVSGLDPVVVERVDVSPQVLAEIGIGHARGVAPQFVARITVDDMIAAGEIG